MFRRYCRIFAISFALFALWRSTIGSPTDEDPFLWVVGLFFALFYLVVSFTIQLLQARGLPFREPGTRYDPQSHLRASDAADNLNQFNDPNP